MEGEAIAGKFKCAFSEVSAAETSEGIIPVFLHLIHRVNIENNNSLRSRSYRSSTDPSDTRGRASVSPVAIRRPIKIDDIVDWDEDNSRAATPTFGGVNFHRQNSLLQCGEKIRSRFEKSYRNSTEKPKEESMFSQRCHSFDEALNLCKMEIYPSNNALDQTKLSKPDIRIRGKTFTSRKKNRPTQMPTGRSKARKNTSQSTLKVVDSKLCKPIDFPNSLSTKTRSHLMLSSDNNIEEDDVRASKRLRHQSEFLSRSVDQNLQKYDNKQTKVSKPLTLLQRGRSFIREAKDKHFNEKEKRLSFRNLSSRNNLSLFSRSPLPIPSPRGSSRPRNLPTSGKTWVSRTELDDDSSHLLDKLTMSCSAVENQKYSPKSNSCEKVCSKDLSHVHPVTDESLSSSTDGTRHRKFSVFSRTIGNFLSRNSMPDLPRATSSIYDTFDLLKRSIKKRSV